MTAFEKIFLNHWERYCDLRLADEVPFDQLAYVKNICLCAYGPATDVMKECKGLTA